MGEQDLGDGQAMRAEELLVDRHEPRLAHRRASLQLRQLVRALLIAQRPHARADRARGDEHNLPARLALLRDLRHQLLHLGQVRLFPAVRQDAGAQLHHYARDVFQYFGTHAQLGSKRPSALSFSQIRQG